MYGQRNQRERLVISVGAKIEDLEANLNDLLHKDLEKVLLIVGTNNAASDSPI